MQKESPGGMDFTKAMLAHAEWLTLLREALYGDGVLKAPMAANPGECRLGKFMKAQEPRFVSLPEYRAVLEAHSRFHCRAAYCLELMNAGRRREALAEIDGEGEMRRLSRLLVTALQRLKKAASEAERRSADRDGKQEGDNR
jgi:hypothetical protein